MRVSGLVSIIIPVFNRAELARQSIHSALDQTYRPIEILVVDDASTDGMTPAVLAELASQHPEIRMFQRPNGGPGLARETGRVAARGEFIQYLDSDDLLLPRKLELQVRALREHAEAGVAYGLTRYRDRNGNEISCTWKRANQRHEMILPSFLLSRWWETATPLYRASVCDDAGPWLPLRLEEDWAYDCRVGALGVHLAFVEDYVAEHRDHSLGRLSKGAALDPQRLGQRAIAHDHIAASALAAVPQDTPEMEHFARELFHLARQCGAVGLSDESRILFERSRELAGTRRGRFQYVAYQALARIAGWRTLGKLSALIDRVR